ncbi:c-type cytochrome [Pseudohalioglobus lutimaris]|uniref:Cytochrome c5 family protein n=1 Tax=Pseudohalioglobus lutimaris TaxID=1737061 RepID=A0A2N5X8N5_9GAMM|nr:c-type cytochrome [Pseudohalioglobus lutimaris]PLW70850.1 cytochrome c5 family protein [Pseudohalioglobus lutimaris]
MKKMIAAALMLVATGAMAELDMAKYNKSCAVCHATGAANAPKTGDAPAWEPRMAKGMDVLVASVNNGLNAMPPKGMCFDCSDEDYKAMIEYMAKPAE